MKNELAKFFKTPVYTVFVEKNPMQAAMIPANIRDALKTIATRYYGDVEDLVVLNMWRNLYNDVKFDFVIKFNSGVIWHVKEEIFVYSASAVESIISKVVQILNNDGKNIRKFYPIKSVRAC
jgi:hypothetical protein